MLPAPATHGRPMPRATTAAWLVMPPLVVKTPSAACKPWMSSGLVSMRTRITFSPSLHRRTASSATGCTRRGWKALGNDVLLGLGVESRMQELVDQIRLQTQKSLRLGDQAFVGHVNRNLQSSRSCTLSIAGLQHVELALLDRKLDVLHVLVVSLELLSHREQLLEDVWHDLFQGWQVGAMGLASPDGKLLWSADACHNIFSLSVDQKFTIEFVLASGRIASEGNSGSTVIAHVTEDHGLHVHCCAPPLWDVMQLPVGLCTLIHPGVEDCTNGSPKLLLGILWELLAKLQLDHRLVGLDQFLQVLWKQLAVLLDATLLLGALQVLLEVVDLNAEDNIRIHLHKAPVAVESEATVTRLLRQSLHCGVVQTQIQHCVHHSWHGRACSRAHGHQQRIGVVAELASSAALDQIQGFLHLLFELLGILAAVLVEVRAKLRCDSESRRHGQSNGGHLSQICTFST
eukprot:Skav233408  [mRNA]  locus=scaffold892:134441:141349:+ [translate_table: standard]